MHTLPPPLLSALPFLNALYTGMMTAADGELVGSHILGKHEIRTDKQMFNLIVFLEKGCACSNALLAIIWV